MFNIIRQLLVQETGRIVAGDGDQALVGHHADETRREGVSAQYRAHVMVLAGAVS